LEVPSLPSEPRAAPKAPATAKAPAAAPKAAMREVELPGADGDAELELSDELAEGESLLIDVTPLSLRVETVGGFSDVLIAANSQVPCDRTRVFSNASDGQTQVFIRVAQGEAAQFAQNTFLGELELSGLVPLARGEAQIAVTFEIDADGILAVHAKDGRTGRETKAKMHVFGAQTDEGDVEAMMARQRQRRVV
jgi:molecular chaperone DnaK